MTHPRTSRLRRYVLGEADATERLVVEEHLPACPRCRAYVEQHARLDQWLVETCPVPDSPRSERAAFDRLWAEVDRQSAPAAPATAPLPSLPAASRHPLRRAAIVLASAALAAALVLGALWWWNAPRAGTSGAPVAVGSVRIASAPVPPVTDEADRIDTGRLTAVRADLAAVLRDAQSRHPDDDAAFAAACSGHVQSLRADGWPVQNLVRTLAQDDDAALVGAAVHYSLCDDSCGATLAEALARPAWRGDVTARLAAPTAATTRKLSPAVIASLGCLVTAAPEEAALELRAQAMTALAHDASPAARTALPRLLQRVLEPCSGDRDAQQAAQVLLDAAPADLAVSALLQAAQDRTLHESTAPCFAALAADDPARWGAALAAVLPQAPAAQVATGAAWAQAAQLSVALPPLRVALDAQPEAGPVLDAVVALGGPEVVVQLHALTGRVRGQPAEEPLRAALLRCLADADAACVALAASVAAERGEPLPALAEPLPPPRRATLLLAGLESLPDTPQARTAREGLLTALARLGDEEAGARLLAWIATRPRTDRVIALAWTTATRLDLQGACDAWQQAGGDPALLVAVAGDRTSWPHAAPVPPARLLRQVDQSLRRLASETSATPASARPAPAAARGPSPKETL